MNKVKCYCPKCGFQLTKELEIIRKSNGPANPPLGAACDLSFIGWEFTAKCTHMHLGLTVNERNCNGITKVRLTEPLPSLSLSIYSHEVGCKQCLYMVGYKHKQSHDINRKR